jgi:hypothetical protein
LEPGKASNTILAVCREGDTCIVHAIGTLEQNFHIERVISVDKLCTADDGTARSSFVRDRLMERSRGRPPPIGGLIASDALPIIGEHR